MEEHEEVEPALMLVGEQVAETEVTVTGVVTAMVAEADWVGS